MKNPDKIRNETIQREAGKPGLRGKINAMCCSCIYDPYSEGNWRQQVEKCTSKACPLYSVRPVSKPEIDAVQQEE